jgi:hypothetical protein
MVQAFGGNVIGAKKIMHGKISPVHHINKANDNLSPQAIKHKKTRVGNPDPVLGQPVDVGVQVLSWDSLLMLESRSYLGTTC